MKKTILFSFGIIAMLLIVGCSQVQQQTTKESDEEFYETIPIIDAYHEGEKIWFIHTDVTDPKMAERLTMMVDYKTLHVPKNAEAVDINKIAKLYVFTNGIDQSNVKPWGGGPFNYQIDIFDSVPGDEGYTSVRNPHLVTWNEDSTPRILKTEKELLEAEANGELVIKGTPVVVNVPVVRWSGGQASLR
jgi:hypothetical protein